MQYGKTRGEKGEKTCPPFFAAERGVHFSLEPEGMPTIATVFSGATLHATSLPVPPPDSCKPQHKGGLIEPK
jgi:hypothetical protein